VRRKAANHVTIHCWYIRDGVVHLLSTLGSVVIAARAELGSIITSALHVDSSGVRVVAGAESPLVRRVRGRGLFCAVEINEHNGVDAWAVRGWARLLKNRASSDSERLRANGSLLALRCQASAGRCA
jgi:hypothetical protein